MSQNYGLTETGTYTPDNLIAGSHPIVEIPVTVKATTVGLSRGQILGVVTATGKYTKLDTTKSDGSQTPKAILGADVSASETDTKSFAYVHGEFAKESLTGITDAVALQLQAIGIYAKGVK